MPEYRHIPFLPCIIWVSSWDSQDIFTLILELQRRAGAADSLNLQSCCSQNSCSSGLETFNFQLWSLKQNWSIWVECQNSRAHINCDTLVTNCHPHYKCNIGDSRGVTDRWILYLDPITCTNLLANYHDIVNHFSLLMQLISYCWG